MKLLKDHMPYFITGQPRFSDDDVIGELIFWTHALATVELNKVPERYHLKTGHPLSDSMGLEIFIQMVSYLKALQQKATLQLENIEPTILAAQKQVLHYHNTQYADTRKETSHGSNPELPEKNSSNEGKEDNLLHGGETIA